MTIGERIKELRTKHDMTQEELAKHIDSTKQTVYKYENNIITNIPSDKIETIASLLRTTPAYLMGWSDDYRDWKRIGIEEGIYPPKDYEGSYEDYVKHKYMQESDDLVDDYYDTYKRAVRYLESINCSVEEIPKSNDVIVISSDNEQLKTNIDTLVYNYKIFGATRPGVKKLTSAIQNTDSTKNKQAIDTVAAHLAGKDITPKKLKLIEQYIDALFEDEEDNQ